MAFNIGVNVVEVDGRAAPTIVAAPISVTGFLVRSQRGVPDLPVPIRGFSDFVTNFGSYTANLFGAHAVRGFFANGGTEAYAVRVVGSGSSAAGVYLHDRAGVVTLRVTAGRRGREDPGTWGNDLSVTIADHPRGTSAIPAQIIGAATEPFGLSDGDTLVVTVNGGATPTTITFQASDFTDITAVAAADVAAVINRLAVTLRAGVTPNGRLVLASAAPGFASRLDVAGSAATTLGFTGTTANSGNSLPAGTSLAVLQSIGGFVSGSAVRLETHGHVIAPNPIAASITDGAGINVAVDGGTPVTITFTNNDFAGGVSSIMAYEVVAAINRQAQSFTAALTHDNHLTLVSNSYGPDSSCAVAAPAAPTPDATAALGLAGSVPEGGSRQYRELGSVSEAFKYITWTDGLPVGGLPANVVRIQSVEFDLMVSRNGTELERFESLSMQSGLNYYVEAVINDQDSGSGFITVRDEHSGSAPGENAPRPVASLSLGIQRGHIVALNPMASTITDGAGIDVTVDGGSPVTVTFATTDFAGGVGAITPAEVVAAINRQSTGFSAMLTDDDRLVLISDSHGADSSIAIAAPSAPTPDATAALGLTGAVPATVPLLSGSDRSAPSESDYIGDPAQRTGLYAFDTVGIQLLACPETTSPGVVAACLSYCEARGDAMFVGTAPRDYDLEGIKTYASAFRGRKIYGALYAPWIQIVNPLDTNGNNPRLWIPPVGHVAGVYARIAEARGVWKAPAGDEARLRNALGVEFDMTDTDHTDLVKNGSVNGIRAIPGSGIIVDASRTLSTDTRWLFVNVRRLFNFVKVSLRDGLRWVAQEPHDEVLRRKVRFNVITPFLLGLYRQGAFGSDPPEQVFTVKCDAENNPPAEVNLGNFKVEIYFYPVKPAETIIIIVGQQESGATASEA